MSKSSENHSDHELGVIRSGEVYTLAAFKRRLAMKDTALRSDRKAGLRVIRDKGKRAFVLGDDWIDFLKSFDEDDSVCPKK